MKIWMTTTVMMFCLFVTMVAKSETDLKTFKKEFKHALSLKKAKLETTRKLCINRVIRSEKGPIHDAIEIEKKGRWHSVRRPGKTAKRLKTSSKSSVAHYKSGKEVFKVAIDNDGSQVVLVASYKKGKLSSYSVCNLPVSNSNFDGEDDSVKVIVDQGVKTYNFDEETIASKAAGPDALVIELRKKKRVSLLPKNYHFAEKIFDSANDL